MRTEATNQNVYIHCKLVYSEKKEIYIIDRSWNSTEINYFLREWVIRDFNMNEFDFVDSRYKIKHPRFNEKPENAPAMEPHELEQMKNSHNSTFYMYIRPITHQECSICFENINIHEMRRPFQCRHRFCIQCVSLFTRFNHINCPNCRQGLANLAASIPVIVRNIPLNAPLIRSN